jgi:hypothetical protein
VRRQLKLHAKEDISALIQWGCESKLAAISLRWAVTYTVDYEVIILLVDPDLHTRSTLIAYIIRSFEL